MVVRHQDEVARRFVRAAVAVLFACALGGCVPGRSTGADPALTVGTFGAPERLDPWLRDAPSPSVPYVVAALTPGDELVLRSSGRYAGPAPAYRTVIIRRIPDPDTGVLALRKRDILVLVDPRPEDLAALQGHTDVTLYRAQGERPGLAVAAPVRATAPSPGGALNFQLWRPRL